MNVKMKSGFIVFSFWCIANSLFAQTIADFETPASTPALTPAGVTVVSNPDATGNPSQNVAYFQKPSGNWKAVYLDFSAEKTIGNNDRLSLKVRSSTQGRVFVKIVNNGATILENWAPDYNSKPLPNTWTECLLNIASIKNQPFDRIEINASVDNEATATIFLDDVKLINSQSLNGEPIAAFTLSAYQIIQGQSIQFDASDSYDPDGTIASYTWTFGNAGSETGVQAEHPFPSEGIYFGRLIIEDNDGKKAVGKFTINVLPATEKLGSLQFVTPQLKVYEKAEAAFLINESYSNVYDPDVVKVDAEITDPDGIERVVPCFFYQDASYTPDQWTKNSNTGYWMLRFSPAKAGQHHIRLTVTDQEGTTASVLYFFSVAASDAPGFIKPDPANKQYFRHETGEPFYPLGINVAWGTTSAYTIILNNLGAGGANLVRYWQVPFDRQGLEWKSNSGFYKGLGIYSQEAAAEQDSIFSLCEANNLFLQLTIFQHGMFSENINSNWNDNPYKSTNGGPLTAAEQFFYNAQAKAQTKKLLRYIVARWGYSTRLFAWELFNEVNFTGVYPNQSAQWYPGVKSWHDEMGQYIKSLDAFDHPVTTSTDDAQLTDFDLLTGLDNVQYHLYNTSLLSVQQEKDNTLLNAMTRVGLINGEYGLDVTTADVPFDAQRVSIWTGIMTQVPHLMWKWDNYTNSDWANLFQYPAAFIADEDFVSEGNPTKLGMTAAYNIEALVAVGFKAGDNLYGVVYDKIYRSNLTGATVDLSAAPAGNYTVTFTDISTGFSTQSTTDIYHELELPPFSKGVAFKATLNFELVLSADDDQQAKLFKPYPNPASDIIYLGIHDHPTEIELISVTGTTYKLRPIRHVTNDAKGLKIDLRNVGLAPGTYFMNVKTRGRVYHSKLMYTADGLN
ncbi:MAG: PKD domain-containing protein [Cyclobacteriaceae bacterium]